MSAEQSALSAARHLAEHGVPIFLAEPILDAAGEWNPSAGTNGYCLPRGWQTTTADPAVLDGWRPGMGIAAVMGHGVDGLDIDPRNGGTGSAAEMGAAGAMPCVYGVQGTPSQGWHGLIRSLGVRSRDGVMPGIDLKAGTQGQGHGFLWLAPTRKLSKATGEIAAYSWDQLPDLDGLDPADDSGEPLAARIAALRAGTSTPADQIGSGDAPVFAELAKGQQAAVRRYLDAIERDERAALAEVATWPEGKADDRGRGWQKVTADLANRLGRLARATWTPWALDDAEQTLRRVVPATVAQAVDLDTVWKAQRGRRSPESWPAKLDAPQVTLDEMAGTAGKPPVPVAPPVAVPLDGEAQFWSSYPQLQHIERFALARMCSPWAVLGAVLVRLLCSVPPSVQLPPTIGKRASLNAFLALVAGSGGGKGATLGCAEDAVTLGGLDFLTTQPGSGEGITHAYARVVTPRDEPPRVEMLRHSVLFEMSEIDTLTALLGRNGSTLGPVLRALAMGERLGHSYVAADKRVTLAAHSYRAGLIVGVQPERAEALLGEADGGTPQRFLWMPATDPRITADTPTEPEPLHIDGQTWMSGPHVLALPAEVESIVKEAQAARNRGEGDALDGHAILTRLKVTAALTFLLGRRTLTVEVWEMAGLVMAVSDRTRGSVQATLARRMQESNAARGRAAGHQQIAAQAVSEEAAEKRVAASVRRKLTAAGREGMTRGALRRVISSPDRGHFDPAVDALVTAGDVEIVPSERGKRLLWRADQ